MIDYKGLDELFNGFGPLSSFSNRIECAFAFGFITLQQKNTLNFIKKVRNHFAHTPFEATFDKQPVSDWCECISKEKILPSGAIEEIKSLPTDLSIDYITFSGMGEPTLASNLGEVIKKSKAYHSKGNREKW